MNVRRETYVRLRGYCYPWLIAMTQARRCALLLNVRSKMLMKTFYLIMVCLCVLSIWNKTAMDIFRSVDRNGIARVFLLCVFILLASGCAATAPNLRACAMVGRDTTASEQEVKECETARNTNTERAVFNALLGALL